MIKDDTISSDFLYILDIIATGLSFFGSIIICFLCLRMPSPLAVSFKFILAISISDFFYSIANIMSFFETPQTRTLCYLEATMRHSSFILSLFFTTCLAIVSYKALKPQFNQRKCFIRAVFIGPLLCVLVGISL